MKILFVTDLYPIKPGEATTSVSLHNFVKEWIKQGHEVNIIKPNFTLLALIEDRPLYTTGFYEFNGVKIFNANFFTPFCFKFLNKIPNEVKFAQYDLVIGHMPSGIVFANKFARTARKPLVCGVHYSDLDALTNPIYKKEIEEAYKRAYKIACHSHVLQQKFCKILPQYAAKTFVASSGIEQNEDAPKPSAMFSSNSQIIFHSPIRVVTCANLIKRKNIDKLIFAIKDLTGFELTIIGEGSELNNLKEIGTRNIRFCGQLPNEKVLLEMKNSDIFILPSEKEAFGVSYLEAMQNGCITICAKNDGIDGIIRDSENGFLCEPTVEGIKQALLRVKDFKDIKLLKQNGIETAKNYSVEKCAHNYLANCCSR